MGPAVKRYLFVLLLGLCSTAVYARETPLSDAQIAEKLIAESILNYPGNCPCPYNLARNGSRCGKRSAYNRAGGYAPLCFKEDVPAEEIADYRRSHRLSTNSHK